MLTTRFELKKISFFFTFLLLISLLLLLSLDSTAYAQSEQNGIPKIDWQEKIEANQSLNALDYSLMGETIDLHTGGLSFAHTDISLPGNSNLDVSLRRERTMGELHHRSVNADFGDWNLIVPRIDAIVGPTSPWKKTSGDRCSASLAINFPAEQVWIPQKLAGNPNLGGQFISGSVTDYTANDYSSGINMIIPGQGSQRLLKTHAGVDYHKASNAAYTTKSGWAINCINVGQNEGFEATSPQGVTYRFDRVVIRKNKDLGFFDHGEDTNLQRWLVSLRATRVEDVHGNYVNYTYNSQNHLTRIQSNDGRRIDIGYSGELISTASSNGRTWSYDYETNPYQHAYWEGQTVPGPGNQILKEVTRPDSLKWELTLSQMTAGPAPGEDCYNHNLQVVSVKHPNGTNAIFRMEDKMHRTSLDVRTWNPTVCGPYTPGPLIGGSPECDVACGGSNPGQPQQRLKRINVPSVVFKSVHVSGQSEPSNWTYEYESDPGPESSSINDRTNWTKVTAPDGVETTYYHKWHRERDGGALVKEEVHSAGGQNLLRRRTFTYAHPNSGGTVSDTTIVAGIANGGTLEDNVNVQPCIGTASSCFIPGLSDEPMARPGVIMHQVEVVTEQDGNIFTSQTGYNLDRSSSNYSFSHPVSKRSSSNYYSTASLGTDIEYEHNRSKWIIGLPKRTHEVATNGSRREMASYTYDNDGQKISETRYQEPWVSYTYHSDGTLKTIKDELDRISEGTNWKRGKPQTIKQAVGTPDEIVMTQTVDNNGWVTLERMQSSRQQTTRGM